MRFGWWSKIETYSSPLMPFKLAYQICPLGYLNYENSTLDWLLLCNLEPKLSNSESWVFLPMICPAITLRFVEKVSNTMISNMETVHVLPSTFLSWFRGCCCVQSCSTLCDPRDCSPPGSSICGIFQARILELPFPPPEDPLNPGIEPSSPVSPVLAGRFFTTEPSGKPQFTGYILHIKKSKR